MVLFCGTSLLKFFHGVPVRAAEISSLHALVANPTLYYAVSTGELITGVLVAKRMRFGFLLAAVLAVAFATVLVYEATSGVFLERCGCFGALGFDWKARAVAVTSLLCFALPGLWASTALARRERAVRLPPLGP